MKNIIIQLNSSRVKIQAIIMFNYFFVEYKLTIGKDSPNKEYKNYFKMLQTRIINQIELIIKSNNIKINLDEIRKNRTLII